MPGLFSALNASGGTLEAMEQTLNVIQNNVSNASTTGYAAQIANLTARPFDSLDGLSGGVEFNGVQSTRNESAEQFVQQQNSSLGSATSVVTSLTAIQSSFDITGNSGLDAALAQFSTNFSSLAQDPNSDSARAQALVSAQNVALAFQNAASSTAAASTSADQQIQSTVSQINDLGSQIQQINQQELRTSTPDPNLDATLHADLENLSHLVNFTTSFGSNGTVNVLIGGQTPLVLGADAYKLQSGLAPTSPTAVEPAGTPAQVITDGNGNDITKQITGGQLSGLLQVRNSILPGIRGDTTQPGTLNQLAQSFADRVNTILTGGQISTGPPAVPGVALFQYSPGNATGIAQSLTVTSITAQQIATISPGPPQVANGVAQQLASLPTSAAPADQINGVSFTDFYGQMATNFGQQVSDATVTQTQQTQALAQAQSMRSQISGVSLDQEAVQLTDFQRSYEATSKFVNVLDELTQATINLVSGN